MSEIKNTDYRIVQERTLSVIVSEILTIEHNVAKVAMDGAIEIGNRLQEAKAQIDHGDWDDWCQENLNYSQRQAQRFMQIATEYGDKNTAYAKATTLSHLSVSNALQLLQVPEEHVEEFVENHEIDNMTVKELNAEIDNLKVKLAEEEKKHLEDMKNRNDEEVEELEAKVEEFEMEVEDLKAKIETLEAAETEADSSEELEALQTKLEAAEAAADKQKEKLEAEIKGLKEKAEEAAEKKEKEIKERIEVANREAREQAKAESREPELEAEIESLKRKLANSTDEGKVRFKYLADDLQETWRLCVEAARTDDSGKMMQALGAVLDSMRKTIGKGE